jgi:hypothetical protein
MKSVFPVTAVSMVFFFLAITVFSCEEIDNSDDPGDQSDDTLAREEPYEVLIPESVVPRYNRVLGVNISESRAGFDSAFQTVREAGSQVVEINLPWDALEPAEGAYADPDGLLAATSFYGERNIQVFLSIAVINTNRRTAPSYLDQYNYDDTLFIGSFTRMMDWLMAQIPENVTVPGISIGNEVDLLLEGDAWDAYSAFYQEVVSYLKFKYPAPEYGVKTTVMGGVLGGEQAQIQLLNQYSDVVMLNYYPQDEQFRVLEPEMVHQHFIQLVSTFNGREIWFTELGYQSGSEYCSSSKTQQAHFYHELFKAWDTFNQQVKLIIIDWLHDQSPEQVTEWEDYYGSSDPGFVEYLSTLGLRNYDNTDKPAWMQLLEEANTRGWE